MPFISCSPFIVILAKAMIRPKSKPVITAPVRASTGLPVLKVMKKLTKAPTIIMPSTPGFNTPLLWEYISPVEARRNGAESLTPAFNRPVITPVCNSSFYSRDA